MESIWSIGSLSLPLRPCICNLKDQTCSSSPFELRTSRRRFYSNLRRIKLAPIKALLNDREPKNSLNPREPVAKFRGFLSSLPPVSFVMKRNAGGSFVLGLCVATTALSIIAVILYTRQKSKYSHPGSVADLVRRGQLRSDRRGISRPLKYEDPFNNPLVKVGKSNSTVEMCGKVYRLAPVTLTEEQRAIHQKRRSHAYQWKRPKVFLKEGDSVPPDVDPDTIRWIPANHPFATTSSEINEDLAQNNVYQKHGVPFRIQAEHEALQRKLEGLQSEQKLDKLVIDSSSGKDFERPLQSRTESHKLSEQSLSDDQVENTFDAKRSDSPNSSESNSLTEDVQRKPPVV